jgi:hypothetical protein
MFLTRCFVLWNLLAGQKVRPEYANKTPRIHQRVDIEGKSIVALEALVEIKLNSFASKIRPI